MDKPHLQSVKVSDAPEPDSARTELHGIGGGGGGGGWHELARRLAILETHFQYLATKEEIANLRGEIVSAKLWLVVTAIGVMVLIAGFVMAVIRFL